MANTDLDLAALTDLQTRMTDLAASLNDQLAELADLIGDDTAEKAPQSGKAAGAAEARRRFGG